MTVSRITKEGDWTFGSGYANYANQSEEVQQQVVTRIREFKSDWFLDSDVGIDWDKILNSNSASEAVNAVQEAILSVKGVKTIDLIDYSIKDARIYIRVTYTDIYNAKAEIQEGINEFNK